MVALALMSTAAGSFGQNTPTVSKDGLTTTLPHAIVQYVRPAPDDLMSSKIFNNIGYKYPKGLYFCCYGGTISGPNSQLGFQVWQAVAFTPGASTTVTKIRVGLGYFSGANSVNIGLYSDSGGVPGTSLYAKDVSGMPNGGSCCVTMTIKPNIAVTAGTQYWVVVSTDSNSNTLFGFWPFNSTDEIDPVTTAYNEGSGWTSYSGVPAFNLTVYGL